MKQAVGALPVLEAFVVRRDAASGELEAIALSGRAPGGFVGPLLDFRLDAAARRRVTQRTIGDGATGRAATLRELGAGLGPGEAVVGVLLEHAWATTLDDAVARTGGTLVASAPVDAKAIGRADAVS